MLKTLTALVVVFLCLSTQANAQARCYDNEVLTRALADKYQESPIGYGTTSRGNMFELLIEPDGKTWTIIETTPLGISCLRASGEGWRVVTPPPVQEGQGT